VLTPTLKFDGVIVSSPYSVQPTLGVHEAWCGVDDTENYTNPTSSQSLVVNPLISCTDGTTFGFEKNIVPTAAITTLNFTGIVAAGYAKPSLADVYIANVSNVWKNATGGYYIIVDSTDLSNFTVRFGNYIANYSYGTNATQNVVSMGNYSQINPVAIVNALDELTGAEMYPPNATLIIIAHCSRGENYITLSSSNDTSLLLAGKTNFDRMAVRVKYTADMYYSRQLYVANVSNAILNFYMVDAYVNALDRIDFHMLDSNYYSAKLQVYKTIQDETIVITEGYFDASHYFSAYLMEDAEYYIQTVSPSGLITQFGTITVITPATKELSKTTMNLNPEAVLISNNILMNAWMSGDRKTLYVKYADSLNQTQSINISVYFGNGTVFHSVNYTNAMATNSIELSYNTTLYANESFYVTFRVQHQTLGNSPVQYMMSLLSPVSVSLGIGTFWYQMFSIGIVLFTGGITTRRSIIAGTLLSMMVMLVLWGIGWLQVPTVFIAFAAIVSLLGIITYLKQEE